MYGGTEVGRPVNATLCKARFSEMIFIWVRILGTIAHTAHTKRHPSSGVQVNSTSKMWATDAPTSRSEPSRLPFAEAATLNPPIH